MSIHTDAEMEKTRLKKLIAELKKTKRTLDEGQRNIFTLADSTREGIVIHERGIILDANSFFGSLLGFTPAEIVGQPVEKFIAPESRETFAKYTDAESEKPYELIGLRKDESRIIIETFDTTIPFHGRKARVKVFRDITDRRLLEEASRMAMEYQLQERSVELNKTVEALTAERQRFSDVLDALPAYVVLLSPDYHVPFANRFFRERFGESHGRRCFEYLFNRDEPCEVCETYKVIKTMAPLKWEWTGPDGRNYDITDFPFTGPDGSTFILEMGIDITERKQTEAKLEKYRTHLEELVKKRTGQLESANERLQAEIAERRRTEEEIEKLSRFPKENPSPVLRVSSGGTILFGNSASSILLENWGIAHRDTLPDSFREVVIGVMQTGKIMEREVVCGDKIVILNFVPIPGVDYVNIYGLDITERKRAEEALEKARTELEERVKFRTKELFEMNKELQAEIVTRRIAEEKLRETGEILEKTFSTTHISIAYLDREFTYQRVNRAYAEEYGLDENFLVGRNHFALFPDAKNEEIFRKIVETGESYSAFAQPFENPGMPERGIIYLDWSLSPVKDHNSSVEGLIYILVNVTERVLSHQRILESEKKFRELADSLPQTIIETDSRGNITFANRNGLNIFGYTDADARAGLTIFNVIAPEERKSAEKEFDALIKEGKSFSGEFTAKRKNGATFPIIVYANAIIQNDLVTGTRAVVIDITERKKMEDIIKAK